MNNMSPPKRVAKPSEEAYDDLTAIAGIGPARQQWLREAFEIHSYQDLLAFSVSQIETRLKVDKQIVSPAVIQKWLAQARELAAQTNQISQQENGPAKENTIGKINSPIRENGWEPFASFVVEFQSHKVGGKAVEIQTAVQHMEDDDNEHWKGIEINQLCQWIQDQIQDKVKLEPVQEPVQSVPSPKPSAELKITQIRIIQPPQSEMPSHNFTPDKPLDGTVKSDKPFKVEVDFDLSGTITGDQSEKPIKCNAQSYVLDQSDQATIPLGVTEPVTLKKGKNNYTLILPEAALRRGAYRLLVLVTAPESERVLADYIELPVLQAV